MIGPWFDKNLGSREAPPPWNIVIIWANPSKKGVFGTFFRIRDKRPVIDWQPLMGLELSHLMQISKLLLKNEESITLEEVSNYEKF